MNFVIARDDIADDQAVGFAGFEKILAHRVSVRGGHDEDHPDAHVQGTAQIELGHTAGFANPTEDRWHAPRRCG